MSGDALEIVVVEDNPNDVELALRALRKYKLGNRIVVLRDGAEAIEFFFGAGVDREHFRVPRVVLLDLNLPKVDGLAVLRRLKADEQTQAIPIVMLTSSREEKDVIESYRLGVNSYIVKPVDFAQFSEAVRQMGAYWVLLNEPPRA